MSRFSAVVAFAVVSAAGLAFGAEVGIVMKGADLAAAIDTVEFLSPVQRTFVTEGFQVEPGQLDTYSFGDVADPVKVLLSWILDRSRKQAYQINEIQFDVWYDLPGFDVGPFAPPKVMFIHPTSDIEEHAGKTWPRYAVSPNPFRASTVIRGGRGLRVEVCDRAGRAVRALTGEGAVTWDGRDARGRRVEAGVYFVRPVGGSRPGATLVLAR